MGFRDTLFIADEEHYSDAYYQPHTLEVGLYFIEMTDKLNTRRQIANMFFLTINTVLIGITGYFHDTSEEWNWIVSVAGIIICYVWSRLVRSYRALNAIKRDIINEIELNKLPIAPYAAEWEALGRGRDPKIYRPFHSLEAWVPVMFGGLHAIVLLLSSADIDLIQDAIKGGFSEGARL